MNGKHGNGKICAEFTERFQTVFKTNTVDSDRRYESKLQDLLIRNAEYDDASSKVDIGLCQRSLKKMKPNKSPGFDNISAEPLIYDGPVLHVHLCLLFNTMLQHCYVPQDFGFSLIVPLPRDKHDDTTKFDMYRGISLLPAVAKLFEYMLLKLYEHQLTSDPLQFGFKKHSGCCHAVMLFSLLRM